MYWINVNYIKVFFFRIKPFNNVYLYVDSDDDEIMASSPPPQSSNTGLPGGITPVPPVADLPSGGGSSSYQVPQFPIERIECKLAAISSRLDF